MADRVGPVPHKGPGCNEADARRGASWAAARLSWAEGGFLGGTLLVL